MEIYKTQERAVCASCVTAEARRCGVRYIILVVISVETIELTERSVTSVSIHERLRAHYHIITFITVARARGTLLYSPGNEIRIVATAAILGSDRRIGGTCSTRAIETDGPD